VDYENLLAWLSEFAATRASRQRHPHIRDDMPIYPNDPNGTYLELQDNATLRDFGYPPLDLFKLSKPVYPDDTVILRWEKNQECDASYFEATNEHIDASGTATWYWQWTQTQAKANERAAGYEKNGEIETFHRQHFLSGFHFHCDMHHGGCSTLYTCEEVMKATHNWNPEMQTRKILELGRKIYFLHHKLYYIAHHFYYVHVSMLLFI
jgi:hypothetical protein